MFRVEEASAEPARGPPVLALFFEPAGRPSLLATTMHDRLARRPAYVTTTHGARTTLWRVARGALEPVAAIVWAPSPAVERAGALIPLEDVLATKPGTLFGRSPVQTFAAGTRRWKTHDFGLGQRRLTALTADGRTLLAEFFPPSAGVLKPSLTLFCVEGADDVVLTALLAAARPAEWRAVQSPPLDEVVRALRLPPSESVATLPAYSSTPDPPAY